MVNLKGSILNEYGRPVVPEHPILTNIKNDSKNNKFGVTSIYDEIDSPEMKKVVSIMSEFGTVLTGAIFNGNYSIPAEAICKIEGLEYKSYKRYWYRFLPLTKRPIKEETAKIAYGWNNYNFLDYSYSIDHETKIKEYRSHLVLENPFCTRFNFNKLGIDYLINKLNNESEYRCLILRPNELTNFIEEAVSYLYNQEYENPEEPYFEGVLGDSIARCITDNIFDCTNIVLVSYDIVVLAFSQDSTVDLSKLKEEFTVIYDTANIEKSELTSIDSGNLISADIEVED